MNKKNKLIKNTAIILFGKLCTQMISFFLLPLYTSYLVSEEYGTVDLITTCISLLVPLLSLQIEMAVFRLLIDERDKEKYNSSIISTDVILLFAMIFISLIFILIVMQFIDIDYIMYIILITIFNMLNSNFMQISRGVGDNLTFSISSVISGGLTIIFNVLFIAVLKMGVNGMLLAILLSNFFSTTYLLFKLKIYKYVKFSKFNKKTAKNMLKYSIPLVPNGISWWIMNASDRTIISLVLGVAKNGIYAISNKFPSIITSFFGIFNLAWSESISENINDDEKDSYISLIYNNVLKLFGCICLLIITFMPFIFPVLISAEYKDSYFYIPILVLSSFFSLMASQYGSIYIALKKTKSIAVTTFISAIINIIVHFSLIKPIGLYAAAISTAISYFVITLYRHIDTSKYVKIKYDCKLILVLMLAYALAFITYYLDNMYINLIIAFASIIFSFFINKKIINESMIKIKNKLNKKIVSNF